jgi:hypothetical protein
MQWLKLEQRFPTTFAELQALCHARGQLHPTALVLRYGEGGYNALHQDLYGDIFFPIQLVLALNEPGEDYTGGEFVLVQQMPRAQSKASCCSRAAATCCSSPPIFAPSKGPAAFTVRRSATG